MKRAGSGKASSWGIRNQTVAKYTNVKNTAITVKTANGTTMIALREIRLCV
jgi:hypothetical protein